MTETLWSWAKELRYQGRFPRRTPGEQPDVADSHIPGPPKWAPFQQVIGVTAWEDLMEKFYNELDSGCA
jgi:hypothetical protein